jgi:tRNA G18 (ribose-2'-O)-methylase SpoU
MRPASVVDAAHRLYLKKESNGTLRGGEQRQEPHVLCALIEDVRSLWNVGSMFRTSDGAGITQLYLSGVTGSPPKGEISKTSLGAEKTVLWEYVVGAVPILRDLRSKDVQIVGLERTAGSIALSRALEECKVRPPLCLVIGNEVMGISAESLSLCDLVCHLPMRGKKESLNAAVAFGVAAYLISDSVLGSS